jgi:ABC-type transport system substrate-binding protein
MHRTSPRLFAAGVASFALLLSACGGDSPSVEENDAGSEEDTEDAVDDVAEGGGTFSVAITEPQFFSPGNCYESECSQILDIVQPPLLEADPETAGLTPVVAQSVESNDDASEFTITLNEGWTFENGDPIDADAYIRAWNHAAYGPNATQTGATWWNLVEGFDEVQGEIEVDDDGTVVTIDEPAAREMSGLTKVDDYTFKVKLKAPFSQFPLSLTYSAAVAPQPQECIDDPEACNEKPVGFGPYLFDGSWEHDQRVTVKKNPDYIGDNKGNADQIVFKIYADQSTALRDYQAGNLDYMSPLSEELPTAEDAAGSRMIREPSSSFNYLGLPLFDEEYQDLKVRRALSMAIDRQSLIDNIFNGVGYVGDDVITPVVPGYVEGACADCVYNVEEAQKLWDEADPDLEELTFYFNEGSGHERWTEAVGNMWRDAFGIKFNLEPNPWADHLAKLQIAVTDPEGAADNKNAAHGPHRAGWIMDYPSPQNYLDPLYGRHGSSNYTTWRSDAFNDAMSRGNANADATAAATGEFREAADIVLAEMPVIPINFGENIKIYSERVDNMNFALGRGEVRFEDVQVVAQ